MASTRKQTSKATGRTVRKYEPKPEGGFSVDPRVTEYLHAAGDLAAVRGNADRTQAATAHALYRIVRCERSATWQEAAAVFGSVAADGTLQPMSKAVIFRYLRAGQWLDVLGPDRITSDVLTYLLGAARVTGCDEQTKGLGGTALRDKIISLGKGGKAQRKAEREAGGNVDQSDKGDKGEAAPQPRTDLKRLEVATAALAATKRVSSPAERAAMASIVAHVVRLVSADDLAVMVGTAQRASTPAA